MKTFPVLLFLLGIGLVNAQSDTATCITLKPGSDDGFDAEVWSLEATTNFGNHDELRANA